MLLVIVPLLGTHTPVKAADLIYFPETGHSIGGGFKNYWETKGGLYLFGYPLTDEYRAANGRVTQWFERARFEWFPEHAGTPYEVQLGLLGTEATGGRIFPQVPPRANDANHRYFPETKHVVMWGFLTIWNRYGGLGTFGYPISEEIQEVLDADGKWHTVQYFERARFEYWPNFPDGERVLISDLGRKMLPSDIPNRPNVPPNVDATVSPPEGPVGTTFSFNAFGFAPGEPVTVWATSPDQQVVVAPFEPVADGDGSLSSSGITLTPDNSYPTGVWSISAMGKNSSKVSVAYFVLHPGSAPPPPPTPPPTPGLPESKNAWVQPTQGPQGTTFYFSAWGFVPYEYVLIAAFYESGELASDILEVQADGSGSIEYAGIYFQTTTSTPVGVYELYALGESEREAYAYLRVTPASATTLWRSSGSAIFAQPQPAGMYATSRTPSQ